MRFDNRHIIVIGLGDTGVSAARWLLAHGARVTIADSRDNPANAASVAAELGVALRLGAFSEATFADADMLMVSPGVSHRTPAIAGFAARGGEVVGDVELWARAIVGSGAKVIATATEPTPPAAPVTSTSPPVTPPRSSASTHIMAARPAVPMPAACRVVRASGSLTSQSPRTRARWA